MKLIIQIPCFNEEATLPQTIADLPKQIPGIREVEYLVVNDGSTDRTVEVARACGVHHIVNFPNNRGLARAFEAGLDACLKLGADLIVNTDADNQYSGADIPKLIQPILERNADVVVGDRQTDTIQHFSPLKKRLQKLGSRVVRFLSETEVTDATSGFRAYKREAAMALNVVSPFTYTLETVIQAGKKHLAVDSVPVRTNGPTRPSRLFRGIAQYIRRSMVTMVRMYLMYQPLRVFFYLTILLMGSGFLLVTRFLVYHFALGDEADNLHHVQSLFIGISLISLGFTSGMIGLLADVVNYNRRLIEDNLKRTRAIELNLIERGLMRWGGYLAQSISSPRATAFHTGYEPERASVGSGPSTIPGPPSGAPARPAAADAPKQADPEGEEAPP